MRGCRFVAAFYYCNYCTLSPQEYRKSCLVLLLRGRQVVLLTTYYYGVRLFYL